MTSNNRRFFISSAKYKKSFLGFKKKKVLEKYPAAGETTTQKLYNRTEDAFAEGNIFAEPATPVSIKRFPFFSGETLNYQGTYHPSFKLETQITELEFPSDFKVVVEQKALITLKDLMLRNYTEFLYYHKIDRNTIEQIWHKIINFVLPLFESEDTANRSAVFSINTPEQLAKCTFFSGDTQIQIKSTDLRSIDVFSLGFSVRFYNSIKFLNSVTSFRNRLRNVQPVRTLEDLLNTDPQRFLELRNCGSKTIEDARKVILNFLFLGSSLREGYSIIAGEGISSSRETIELSKETLTLLDVTLSTFFSGQVHTHVESSELRAVDIYSLDFPVRFHNALKKLKQIPTLEELLNTHPQQFLKLQNCGRKTIEEARRVVLDFLFGQETTDKPYSIRLHEQIKSVEVEEPFLDIRLLKRLEKALKTERALNILLLRFGYKDGNELTLEEIGEKFGLTRERIRQILLQIQRRIIRNKYTLEEVTQIAKSMDYVMTIGTFVDKLKEHGIWGQSNPKFLVKLLTEFLGKRYGLILDDGYLVNTEVPEIETILKQLNSVVVDIVKPLQEGITIDELAMILKKLSFQNADIDRLATNDTIVYLSKKLGCFHVCDDIACNEMVYQIREGTKLKDVVYYSLKYLGEPSHFSILAEFIRAHNRKYESVGNNLVHATLVRMHYCYDVARGVYALKEWNIPKHVSAGDALINLLQEHGPMLEDDIIENLSRKYKLWNIRMALENNRHKLTKIGNNLLDLRGELNESN